jgi:hypothetical protein
MALVMEQDEAFNPGDGSRLDPQAGGEACEAGSETDRASMPAMPCEFINYDYLSPMPRECLSI